MSLLYEYETLRTFSVLAITVMRTVINIWRMRPYEIFLTSKGTVPSLSSAMISASVILLIFFVFFHIARFFVFFSKFWSALTIAITNYQVQSVIPLSYSRIDECCFLT